jgi:hypothetical protein
MAVYFPNGGDSIFRAIPEHKYQIIMASGAWSPIYSVSFLVKRNISRSGFEKLE